MLPELPDVYKNIPTLPIYLEGIKEAFFELSTDRPLPFGGVGQIPSVAITSYLNNEIYYEGNWYRKYFRYLIRAIDNIYVAEMNKDGKSKNDTNGNNQ